MNARLTVTLMILIAPPFLAWASANPAKSAASVPQDKSQYEIPQRDFASVENENTPVKNSESKEDDLRPSSQPWSHQWRESTRDEDRP